MPESAAGPVRDRPLRSVWKGGWFGLGEKGLRVSQPAGDKKNPADGSFLGPFLVSCEAERGMRHDLG